MRFAAEFRAMAKILRNLCLLDNARSIAPRLEIANTFWKRSIGLLGRRGLESGSGLWIAPCNGIHTLFMMFPIDVIFLSDSGEIIKLTPDLKPWRICGPMPHACVVIELPAGTIVANGLTIGNRLMLNQAEQPEFGC